MNVIRKELSSSYRSLSFSDHVRESDSVIILIEGSVMTASIEMKS